MVTQESLELLNGHWAVRSFNSELLERADTVAKARLVRAAVGQQINIEFADQEYDNHILERAATAYEIAAAETLDALLRPSKENERGQQQTQAAAYRIYDLRRVLPPPADVEARIFRDLHLSAVAYCGDRWAEQRRSFLECREPVDITVTDETPWDRRLLYQIYDCWVRLVRKDGWADLHAVSQNIVALRREQASFESVFLKKAEESASSRASAFRLMALYNWARATELLSQYMLQGEPIGIDVELDRHFEDAREAALSCGDMALDVILRWLHAAGRRMALGSIWSVARVVNSRVTKFVKSVTSKGAMFELLPPQRSAIQREGLLDPAKRAIVVDLPTSGGKTALAQFRILQALNQFEADGGWVAYVAPTRALVAQLTRRLRRDFEPLGVLVEQLSGAVEVDAFEESLLEREDASCFHVLVSTPEKMQFLIRNKKTSRPLALVVLDEAHNIEDKSRGLRIELLLATIKNDCPRASFLLLMPYVPNGGALASWLGSDAGSSISLSTSVWQPNDRIVGMYWPEREGGRGNWSLRFQTLTTTTRSVNLRGVHKVGKTRPLPVPFSDASLTLQTGAIAASMAERNGTSIAVARTIPDAWQMARMVAAKLPEIEMTEEISLVQRFLREEVSPQFELIDMLAKGVGVHHAGLSDDARVLIEWLAENGHLQVLCATSTIAQGINFPVSSVFLATKSLAGIGAGDMSSRSFWNLAGRAGRIQQGSMGVVGIAAGADPNAIRSFVSQATGDLISRIQVMLDELYAAGRLNDLEAVLENEQWQDFRSYIAHLWGEKRSLDAVLADADQILRSTFGYDRLRAFDSTGNRPEEKRVADLKAQRLLEATKHYARKLGEHPENATLADSTGFAPEGVRSALLGLGQLERRLTSNDWLPNRLFGDTGVLGDLIGVMMRVPELKGALEELGGEGLNHRRIAELTHSWIQGDSLEQIAIRYFSGLTSDSAKMTAALSKACRAIYRHLTNFGTWGLASLTRMPTSGIDFESLNQADKRTINMLPAMVYYGVQSEPAILMRMQGVPRSIAESIGSAFVAQGGTLDQPESAKRAREFVRSLPEPEWARLAQPRDHMSGADYSRVWRLLTGAET